MKGVPHEDRAVQPEVRMEGETRRAGVSQTGTKMGGGGGLCYCSNCERESSRASLNLWRTG